MPDFLIINNLVIDEELYETIESSPPHEYNKIDFQIDGKSTSKNNLDDLLLFINKNKIKHGVIAIKDIKLRAIVARSISEKVPDFIFVSVIHPTSIIGRKSKIGKGSIIMANTIINTYTNIKDFCIIESNTSIDHDSIINNFSNINSGVTTGGNLQVGEETIIDLGVCILENITIGNNCHVRKGALVTKDIEANTIASGVPAKKII
ncbi:MULTISPECIES: acetyltransferase [Cellulophaga]|uniref:acetyltransferase n=1 Tax=Cellulophaga TaxID=104264 RepID=UPI0003FD52CA|nr:MULTISPECIES: acetyltransferase [Cellulophaga]